MGLNNELSSDKRTGNGSDQHAPYSDDHALSVALARRRANSRVESPTAAPIRRLPIARTEEFGQKQSFARIALAVIVITDAPNAAAKSNSQR
jgi:hypothetical protein